MTKAQFSDYSGMPVQIGSIVADATIEDTVENYDIYDILYFVVNFDPMSEIAEMVEVSTYVVETDDKGGKDTEYAPIYCTSVKTLEFGQIVQIWL